MISTLKALIGRTMSKKILAAIPLLILTQSMAWANPSQAETNSTSTAGGAEQELVNALTENRGKVIYLDFWASWCVPCRKSFPWMNKIQSRYAPQNFTVISVNVDKDFDLAQRFLADMPASFPVIYDPKGELASKYKLQGMPSSFLVNKEGKFVRGHKGFFEKKIATYESEIEHLLKD